MLQVRFGPPHIARTPQGSHSHSWQNRPFHPSPRPVGLLKRRCLLPLPRLLQRLMTWLGTEGERSGTGDRLRALPAHGTGGARFALKHDVNNLVPMGIATLHPRYAGFPLGTSDYPVLPINGKR